MAVYAADFWLIFFCSQGKWVYLSLFFSYLQQGKQKGAKNKINLRRSPFYLQDGDIIGVKVINLKPLPLSLASPGA